MQKHVDASFLYFPHQVLGVHMCFCSAVSTHRGCFNRVHYFRFGCVLYLSFTVCNDMLNVLVNWRFEPSKRLGIISGLKETFLKR